MDISFIFFPYILHIYGEGHIDNSAFYSPEKTNEEEREREKVPFLKVTLDYVKFED